jgi:hypothetical protein
MTSDELTSLQVHLAKRLRLAQENLQRVTDSRDPNDAQRLKKCDVYAAAVRDYRIKLDTLATLTEADAFPQIPLEPQFGA